MARLPCAPNAALNDALPDEVSAHDERRRLIEAHTAVLLRRIHTEQAELTSPAKQVACEAPVFLLEAIDAGHNFLGGKFLRGPRDHAMLVGDALGSEDG